MCAHHLRAHDVVHYIRFDLGLHELTRVELLQVVLEQPHHSVFVQESDCE